MLNDIKDGRYHKQVCWNNCFDKEVYYLLNKQNTGLLYSHHCQNHIIKNFFNHKNSYERRVNLSDINKDSLINGSVFEVVIEKGQISKAVIRFDYNERRDVTAVILFKDGFTGKDTFLCLSYWVNNKKDTHKRFDRNLYVQK